MNEKGVVIVTGDGRGIGARIAVRIAQTDAPVAIVYRNRGQDAASVVQEVEQAGGCALAICADVSIEAEVLRAFDVVDRAFGRLAGLVNSAATNGGRARVADVSREQLEVSMATNLIGPFLCCREAVRRMSTARQGQGGTIVTMPHQKARLRRCRLGSHVKLRARVPG